MKSVITQDTRGKEVKFKKTTNRNKKGRFRGSFKKCNYDCENEDHVIKEEDFLIIPYIVRIEEDFQMCNRYKQKGKHLEVKKLNCIKGIIRG